MSSSFLHASESLNDICKSNWKINLIASQRHRFLFLILIDRDWSIQFDRIEFKHFMKRWMFHGNGYVYDAYYAIQYNDQYIRCNANAIDLISVQIPGSRLIITNE